MILEIDAGNTFVKWRLRQAGQVVKRGRLLTAEGVSASSLFNMIKPDEVWVSSVAGVPFNNGLAQQVRECWQLEPVFVQTRSRQSGVTNSYQDPSRMGVDRWVAMLAAFNDCGRGCCVVDCGSAITVEYLNDDGEHLGGYIMPGLRVLQGALLANTAEIIVDRTLDSFSISPAGDTSGAVGQGVNFMFKALQEKLVSELGEDCPLYITGGDGHLFAELSGVGRFVDDLVLDGLRWAV